MVIDVISRQTEERILNDLQRLILAKKPGKIELKKYIDPKEVDACMDFAVIYEASDALQALIRRAMQDGIGIVVGQDRIEVV